MFYFMQFFWGWVIDQVLVPCFSLVKLRGNQPLYRCGSVWTGLHESSLIYAEARKALMSGRTMRFTAAQMRAMQRCNMVSKDLRYTEEGAQIINAATQYAEVFPGIERPDGSVVHYLTA